MFKLCSIIILVLLFGCSSALTEVDSAEITPPLTHTPPIALAVVTATSTPSPIPSTATASPTQTNTPTPAPTLTATATSTATPLPVTPTITPTPVEPIIGEDPFEMTDDEVVARIIESRVPDEETSYGAPDNSAEIIKQTWQCQVDSLDDLIRADQFGLIRLIWRKGDEIKSIKYRRSFCDFGGGNLELISWTLDSQYALVESSFGGGGMCGGSVTLELYDGLSDTLTAAAKVYPHRIETNGFIADEALLAGIIIDKDDETRFDAIVTNTETGEQQHFAGELETVARYDSPAAWRILWSPDRTKFAWSLSYLPCLNRSISIFVTNIETGDHTVARSAHVEPLMNITGWADNETLIVETEKTRNPEFFYLNIATGEMVPSPEND